jgi:hypothetical protein
MAKKAQRQKKGKGGASPRKKESLAAEGLGKLGSRKWKLDMDYVSKLSDKEKEWLTSFVREEVLADFAHSGKKLNKTKKAKREIYNKNNASNRCIYSLGGIKTERVGDKKLESQEVAAKWRKFEATKDEIEDAMIELIDFRAEKKSEESEE